MVILVDHRSCQRSDILDTCKHLLVVFSPIFYAPQTICGATMENLLLKRLL